MPLKVLLVGVDSDSSLAYAEHEAESLKLAMRQELESLGIDVISTV